ncbi:MAG: desulfoferrodoxin family protein [Candidatus Methanomethylophilaceae archaeon]
MSPMVTYRCGVCGKIVQEEFPFKGTLSCCGQDMQRLEPRSADTSSEKHVPYVERRDGGVMVSIGRDAKHPMTPEHHIIYIEVKADGIVMRKYLRPGDEPEAFFRTDASHIEAAEVCNIHGLWVS